jgi:hypothetical protein
MMIPGNPFSGVPAEPAWHLSAVIQDRPSELLVFGRPSQSCLEMGTGLCLGHFSQCHRCIRRSPEGQINL